MPRASSSDLDPLFRFPTHVLSLIEKAQASIPLTTRLRGARLFRKAASMEREQRKRISQAGQTQAAQTKEVGDRHICRSGKRVQTESSDTSTRAPVTQRPSPAAVEAWEAHAKLWEYRDWCRARGQSMDSAAAGYFSRGVFPAKSCAPGRPKSDAVLSDQIRCAAAIYLAEFDGTDADAAAHAIAAKLSRRKSFAVQARKQFSDEECRAQLGLMID